MISLVEACQINLYIHCLLSEFAGDAANEVLKDSCQDLMLICQHARKTFEQVVQDFKNEQALEVMNMEQ